MFFNGNKSNQRCSCNSCTTCVFAGQLVVICAISFISTVLCKQQANGLGKINLLGFSFSLADNLKKCFY